MPIYKIRVQGRLDQRWSSWFDGLTLGYEGNDITVLRGPLVDEAALHGGAEQSARPGAAAARGELGRREQVA